MLLISPKIVISYMCNNCNIMSSVRRVCIYSIKIIAMLSFDRG